MYYLFGIPNCDTVKKARNFLDKKSISYEFIDFKKSPPDEELIKLWTKVFGALPVNKKGLTYKKHSSTYESLSEGEKIKFLMQNTSMIRRPILQKDKKVLSFGFEENEYLQKIGG